MATFELLTSDSPGVLLDLAGSILAQDASIDIDNESIEFVGVTGENAQTSFYDGSLEDLGIGPGILLTSGSGNPPLENTSSGFGVSQEGNQDDQLQAVVADAFPEGNFQVFDVNSLGFDFTITDPDANAIVFDLVFGSDEFPEFVDSFVDIAAVFVNDENVALFENGLPLSVLGENLDEGNFINNTDDDNTGDFEGEDGLENGDDVEEATSSLPIEYDGVSSVLSIVAPVVEGKNTIKFAVSDTGDQILDSGLFISNLRATTNAGSGNDGILINLPGTEEPDVIEGVDDDNEFIAAGGGNDVINAGGGNDTVDAGEGDDLIQGGDGNDSISGGDGNDVAFGNADADSISGDDGNDSLYGDFFSDSAETLSGGKGDDIIFGFGGDDKLFGGEGDDLLDGGAGADELTGGIGADTFQFLADSFGAIDTITDFEVGVDTIRVFGVLDNTATLSDGLLTIGGEAIANINVDPLTVNVNGIDVNVMLVA